MCENGGAAGGRFSSDAERDENGKRRQRWLHPKGLSASTRGVVRAVLSRSLADAVADDLIATNPCSGARRAGGRAEPRKFTGWTDAELCSLLGAAEGERLEALWRLAFTLDVYAHVLPTSDEQAAEVVAAVLVG
jgi:hypothetical protein